MKRLLAAGLVVTALAGCSGSDGTASPGTMSYSPTGTATTPVAPSSTAVAPTSTGPTSSVPAVDVTPSTKAEAITITDDLLKHRIEVTKMTRGLTSATVAGKEVVILEVDITPGDLKGPDLGAPSFVATGGENVTTSAQALFAEKGLLALPDAVTGPTKGAVALAVPAGSKLDVAYVRPIFRNAKGRIFPETPFPLAL